MATDLAMAEWLKLCAMDVGALQILPQNPQKSAQVHAQNAFPKQSNNAANAAPKPLRTLRTCMSKFVSRRGAEFRRENKQPTPADNSTTSK